jgi:hypothetical protein
VNTCKMFEEATEGERVKIEGRDLSISIPHALMTEFIEECNVITLTSACFSCP